MERPIVRVIDNQEENINNNPNFTSSEMNDLLAKYGYKSQGNVQVYNNPVAPVNNQTFDEMIREQEAEERRIQEMRRQRMYGPKPITFSNDSVGYSETRYSSMDLDSGSMGIQVTIVTDMKF
jgi:hypothetical protein